MDAVGRFLWAMGGLIASLSLAFLTGTQATAKSVATAERPVGPSGEKPKTTPVPPVENRSTKLQRVVRVVRGPLVVRESPTPKSRTLGTLASGAQAALVHDTVAPPGWAALNPSGYVSLVPELVELRMDEPRFASSPHVGYARAEAHTQRVKPFSASGELRFRSLPPLARRSYLHIVSEFESERRRWSLTSDGTAFPSDDLHSLLPSPALTLPRTLPSPQAQVTPENCSSLFGRCPARVIEVDASSGFLFALEHGEVRFVTRVSIGRDGFEALDGRERVRAGKTPLGVFTVLAKHRSLTMSSSGSTVVHQDVPWTLHFWGPYAIHAAYWHDQFGSPMSGGCVNVSLEDGERIFNWVTPSLPTGWHSVAARATGEEPTTIWIHR